MENFKRSFKRYLNRFSVLGLVVICGAIAIAQVQKHQAATGVEETLPDPLSLNGTPTSEHSPVVIGLPVRNEPARLAAQPAEPLDRMPLSPDDFRANELPHQESSGNEFAGNEFAGNQVQGRNASASVHREQSVEFINDPQVARTQATADRFSRRFSNRFENSEAAGSAVQDLADDGPPRFDDFAGPPSIGDSEGFDNAPGGLENELPSVDSPVAPAPGSFAAGLPENFDAGAPTEFAAGPPADFDAGFPSSASAAGVASEPPRFANPQAVAPAPSAAGNRLRQPASTTESHILPAPSSASSAISQDAPVTLDNNAYAPREFGSEDSSSSSSLESYPPADANLGAGGDSLSIPSTGLPAPELEGSQAVSVSVHKTAPEQAYVGEPATFDIRVRNNSNRAVERVVIRDQIPKGTDLIKTDPPAKQASTGGVYWEIDTLQAGEERTVSMQVMPQDEQLIGSVAEVSFAAMASAQIQVHRPMLEIEHTTAPEVMMGETVRFAIVIENPGTGTAKDVIIEEDVPQGLSHTKGARLDYRVGDIPPGGQRRLELSLKAAEAGLVTNTIRARGRNGLVAEHQVEFQVVAPDLKVIIDGPSTRYLERKATYTVELQNRGTAAAKNIQLQVQLPRGLQFVNTDSKGRYDASSHTIHWLLRALEPNKGASVKLTVDPQQKGSFVLNAVATADRGLRDSQDHPLTVDGIAALLFEVADQVDPIEVGGVTTYSIQVTNQGTKEASNVEFLAQVPPGMEAIAPQGTANYQVEGDLVRFEPIARLAAKQSATYSIQVRGRAAGDQRFKVQMTSADTPTPVVEEESTRVYSDQ